MRWLPLGAYSLLAAATVAAALALAGESGARARVVSAAGGFELSNSREGEPVFTASGIGPGDSATGTVELAGGGEAAELTLTRGALADTPGMGGGLLSAALTLRVRELGSIPATVYSGPLAAMPPQQLGRIEPGEARRFEFVATLPEAGPEVDQNALQGAATSVAYSWTATAAGEEPGPVGPGVGPADPLDLAVTKVRRRVRGGRLMVWVSCDRPCVLSVRGKLRARDGDDRRRAKLRSSRDRSYQAGIQRLRIKLPRPLRRWLAADPSHERIRAHATFVARDAGGERAVVKRVLRLRSAR